MKFRIFVSTVLVMFFLGQTTPVLAATYNVPCKTNKLVKAISDANATPTDDTINLEVGCIYTLQSFNNRTFGDTGLPIIEDAALAGKLTINGNGATIERINARGARQFRIFAIATGGDLTLNNITLRNGYSADYGGGILVFDGILTITDSLIDGNTSIRDGAGINSSGSLTVTRTTFSNNVSQGLGGGILVAGGTANVINSTFSSNSSYAPAGGSGILNGGFETSVLTIVDSTFTNNYAEGAGGALFNTHLGVMTITNSTISGNQAYNGGGIFNAGILTVSHSTISNNNANSDGGGIWNAGMTTVNDSKITENSAKFGGGISSGDDSGSGTLIVNNSLLDGNTSIYDGAGINSSGTLTVVHSTFSGNTAGIANTLQGLGGGILVAEGIATVSDSTFSGNVAYGGAGGGGILNGGCGCGPSELRVVSSTFTNNIGNGGALFNTVLGTMTVTNSTISGNQSVYRVGGIFNAGTLTVTHSTITGNTSLHEGGGILNDGGIVNLGSTIVAGNTAQTGPDIFGLINSLGYNLIGNTSDATIAGDITGNLTDNAASPLNLGPLQDNGGPTLTIALESGSVAINAGDPTFAPPPDYDQRGDGFPRVIGGRIDIGAYESNP